MDQTSHSSNQDLSQGHAPVRSLVRRDTASSAGSDKYLPMPTGHWLLDLHGNCPRCRHHHTAVKIKINVTHDSSKFSRVQCENCKENWLAFAGNNSTQISLLSTATINPDPVEKEVRLTLINLVRSATTITAIASPTLTRIPESSPPDIAGEPSTRRPASNVLQPVSRASGTPGRVSFNIPAPNIRGDTQSPRATSPVSRSVANEQNTRGTRHALFNLKQRVKTRITRLQKLSLRRFLGISKGSKVSAKRAEKLPVELPVAENPPASNEHSPEPIAHDEQHSEELLEPNHTESDVPEPSNRTDEAARFIDSVKNVPLELMDKKERIAWMRGKLTQFKEQRAKSTLSRNSTTVDIGTQVPRHESPYLVSLRPHHLPDFFGLGSHFGYSERFSVSDPSLRTHPISISERTSEAPTVVDDSAVASNPRLSRLFQREHLRSGSPRPQSLHSVWHHVRQHRDQTRTSLDSTGTGGAVRSASVTRDRAVHRRSRGSIGWTSTLGFNEMSMSQTSFHQPMDEEEPAEELADNQPRSTPLSPLPPPSPTLPTPARQPSA